MGLPTKSNLKVKPPSDMMGPPTDVLLEVPVVQEANYREGFVFCQQFCQHYANTFKILTKLLTKNQIILGS